MKRPSAQTVLEELLSAAIEAALKARKHADRDAFENGKLMAYYDIITTAKEQAEVMGIEFADKTIADFDPDKELLGARKQLA
jgi:hypothetical protein